MRIPLEWLKEFIAVDMAPYEIASSLTMAGLEVESIERLDKDYVLEDNVLEVNVTSNRPDCLSILGIARELSAITGMPLRFPEHTVKEAPACECEVVIRDKALCKRYAGRVINSVTIAESPQWIRNRLEKCKIRAINNVVDITNYVLLELGHPLHAFDLDTLKGKIIMVGRAGQGQGIVTIDGAERKLPSESLLIWDKERPVAIAGIMGGKETEVTDSTRNVFVEGAWFDPGSVRRTSRTLGIASESSYRFERAADIEMIDIALDRAAFLINTVAGGLIQRKIDVYPERFVPHEIRVRPDKINRLLGTDMPSALMADILRRLNLKVEEKDDYLKVTPTSYRLDIERESDVAEELARLYGYQRIPTGLPSAAVAAGGNDKKHRLIPQIKEAITIAGFNEAVNFSFMNADYLNILGIPGEDIRRRGIAIKNPLRKEDSLLRTMLIPSLIENFKYNFSRGLRDINIFEVSRVFIGDISQTLPLEPLRLSGISYREMSLMLWKEQAENFYLIKGALESLFNKLRLSDYSFLPSAEPFLHAGKSADVFLSKEKIGALGVLSPAVTERLDVKPRADIVVFELDMDKLLGSVPDTMTYTPMPKFPCIERDIAIIVGDNIMAADIAGIIKAYPSEFIEEVSPFDFYKGPNIPQGKKSLAFNIRYRSKDRTLRDEEIEDIHHGLIKHIVEKTGGQVRGH